MHERISLQVVDKKFACAWPSYFLLYCATIDDLRSSRIKSFQRFLVRSCQNELMRSNNFVVKVAGKKCSEVEAQANNYENKASV